MKELHWEIERFAPLLNTEINTLYDEASWNIISDTVESLIEILDATEIAQEGRMKEIGETFEDFEDYIASINENRRMLWTVECTLAHAASNTLFQYADELLALYNRTKEELKNRLDTVKNEEWKEKDRTTPYIVIGTMMATLLLLMWQEKNIFRLIENIRVKIEEIQSK